MSLMDAVKDRRLRAEEALKDKRSELSQVERRGHIFFFREGTNKLDPIVFFSLILYIMQRSPVAAVLQSMYLPGKRRQ